MSAIAERYPSERQTLREAYDGLTQAEAKAQLAITFLEDHLLTNPDAKSYLERAKKDGTKLTVADKEAIVTLETQAKRIAYDLAKFDCETSDKEYSKLEAILSYYQSLMKFTGQTVRD